MDFNSETTCAAVVVEPHQNASRFVILVLETFPLVDKFNVLTHCLLG